MSRHCTRARLQDLVTTIQHLKARGATRSSAARDLAPGAGHSLLPVHRVLLVEHGIHILENVYLEQLAADRVREFLFVCLPLKFVGATGSPVRPIAVASP